MNSTLQGKPRSSSPARSACSCKSWSNRHRHENVIKAILRGAVTATPAETAVSYLLEEDQSGTSLLLWPIAAITHGIPVTFRGTHGHPLNGCSSLFGACVRTNMVINIKDIAANTAFEAVHVGLHDKGATITAPRSVMCVPFARDKNMGAAVLGVIYLASQRAHVFTRQHEVSLASLASIGAAALDRVPRICGVGLEQLFVRSTESILARTGTTGVWLQLLGAVRGLFPGDHCVVHSVDEYRRVCACIESGKTYELNVAADGNGVDAVGFAVSKDQLVAMETGDGGRAFVGRDNGCLDDAPCHILKPCWVDDGGTGKVPASVLAVPIFHGIFGTGQTITRACCVVVRRHGLCNCDALNADLCRLRVLASVSASVVERAWLRDEAVISANARDALVSIADLASTFQEHSKDSDMKDFLERAVKRAYKVVEAERITLFVVDETADQLVIAVSKDAEGLRIPSAYCGGSTS